MVASIHVEGSTLQVETECCEAAIATEGYVSGVMAGSFRDKRTGSRDLGSGLVITDFLLEPAGEAASTPEELRYTTGDMHHGNIPKRYVELPQLCTQAKKLPFEMVYGDDFVAVHLWWRWSIARPPYRPGSLWEQWLVFPDGVRWFIAYDRVTSVNTVASLVLRMDMPGHLRHQQGDTFRQIYLSYHGTIPAAEFTHDFPPDAKFLYQRSKDSVPHRFIRAYQLQNGAWLAGMTLEPSLVYESWCHQRGYVCFIHEIGGCTVCEGGSFGAVNLVGYFDDIAEMEEVYDNLRGVTILNVASGRWWHET